MSLDKHLEGEAVSLDKPVEDECEGCKELALALSDLRDRVWRLEDEVEALKKQMDDALYGRRE